jgi:adenylate cyclase class 2
MPYEVEIKFRVPNHDALIAALEAIDASPTPPVAHSDLYLAHPSRDFAKSDEALRLRREGETNAVTYKGPKRGGPTKTREEVEVTFDPDSRDNMARIFEALGFLPVAEVKKTRTSYPISGRDRPMTVTLDDAEGLGTFAEVEAIAQGEADLPNAQQAVLALAKELGLTDVEPRSYLRMKLEAKRP